MQALAKRLELKPGMGAHPSAASASEPGSEEEEVADGQSCSDTCVRSLPARS